VVGAVRRGQDERAPVLIGGRQWETLFDRAQARNPANIPGGGGPTFRYYNSDLPFAALFGQRAIPWTRPICDYFAACEAGTLENIVFVDPPFTDGGGGEGLSQDEHPHGDVRLGQAWMSDVVHAFLNSVHYRRGALFINYDEWGGFFDHVRPPKVPDDRASHDLDEDFGQMGYRTPAVAISPFTLRQSREGPRVNHGVFGHESIIKFITYRFGLGHLVLRDKKANNIGQAFNFNKHDFEPADLVDPDPPVTGPCEISEGTEHQEEFQQLADFADPVGFPVNDCTPDVLSQSGSAKGRKHGSRKRDRKHHGDEEGLPGVEGPLTPPSIELPG
jgi:phospholipase C